MYRKLSKELKEKAAKELNEDENRLEKDLEHIKEWIMKQPHLNARLDDQWILAFLRKTKFRLEKTKQKIDSHYTVRSMLPELFKNRDPFRPEIQEILKIGPLLPLIDLEDPLQPPIVLVRASLFDPDVIKLEDAFKTHYMWSDILCMEYDSFLINGAIVVLDYSKIHPGHASAKALSFFVKVAMVAQRCTPIRPKIVYILNANNLFTIVYKIVKPVLTEKLRNRARIFSGSYEDLFQILPRKVFPNEYGGEAGPLDKIIEENKKRVESYRDWFLEDEKYGCDESKRPGKPKTSDEMLGVEGSFRKLDID